MRHVLLVLAALMVAPFTLAHMPPNPNTDCEPSDEWHQHDYVLNRVGVNGIPPGARLPVDTNPVGAPAVPPAPLLAMDGNLGSCSGGSLDPGTVCTGFEDPEDPLTAYVGLCDAVIPVAEWDGHDEFAIGGAILLAENGWTSPSGGTGSLHCYGAEAHHPHYGPITVDDVVLGAGAAFDIAADSFDLTALGDGCGDFQSDEGSTCIGTCTVTFAPGLDGAYVVYVQGVAGHVYS